MNFERNITSALVGILITLTFSGCGGGGGSGALVATSPPAAVLFSDSFNDAASWDYVDNTGNGDAWAVYNGKLSQFSNMEIPNLDAILDGNTSYHLGTYALLSNPAVNGSYRFSVDITPLPETAGNEGNDVGIMFGVQDDNNYYRVSMNARYGFTRFEKRVNGNFQTLAVNARGYVDNQPMTMMAEVNGGSIVVWINGLPVFAHVDFSVLSGSVALYCQDRAQFDNVLITENPLQPLVAISSPLAYSVEAGGTLTAQAVVLNMPAGGSVVFRLNGGSEAAAVLSGNYYVRTFSGLTPGNSDIVAILKNAGGVQVSYDTNSMVGTGGDYYITVGDSITNGTGDEDDSNNDSTDGRIVGIQGYQATLSNLLTAPTGQPQIIFNEGIPGDTASELSSRIDSILDRHPQANKVLMMIGTNDSSGSGVDPDDFENDVITIANQVNVDGKQIWLAEILPTNGDTFRNNIIIQYNTKIRGIANPTGPNIFLGPDFYSTFINPANQATLYTDTLHPNDLGYLVMANGWDDSLSLTP